MVTLNKAGCHQDNLYFQSKRRGYDSPEGIGKREDGKSAALISVEDIGLAMFCQDLFQNNNAKSASKMQPT